MQSHRSFYRSKAGLAVPASLWLLLFFILPLGFIVVISFMTQGKIPSEYQTPITLQNYREVLQEPYRTVLVRSVLIALKTTLVCSLMGYLLAFFISTRRPRRKPLALFLVILPFWTNFLIRTYAWRAIIGRHGILNDFLIKQLHLIHKPLELLNTETAVLVGLVYGFLPFMVLPIYASLERFDFHLVEAAHDLGANDWQVFWRVIFPLTLPGLAAGWILVFIPAIGAFITPDLLGGTQGMMIGNLIQRQFRGSGGRWTVGAAMSMVIMLSVMVALLIFTILTREANSHLSKHGWTKFKRYFFQQHIAQAAAPTSTSLERLSGYQISRFNVWRDLLIRRMGRFGLTFSPIIIYSFLWFPILLLVTFSFNNSERIAWEWNGFTTTWYSHIFSSLAGKEISTSTEDMLKALKVSFSVGLTSTILATLLGTMVAVALARSRFYGKDWVHGLLYLPVVIPDITQGISLLAFFSFLFRFLKVDSTPQILVVIVGHVAFSLSVVAVVVRSRLVDLNPRHEEAAQDLGANEWRTFWRVTYPLLRPGIIAGALLAFTLSMDDFVVAFFAGGGSVTTLPIFVYSLVRRSVTSEINAISTLMMGLSTVLIVCSMLLQQRIVSVRYLEREK